MRMFSLLAFFFSGVAASASEGVNLQFHGLRNGDGYLAVSVFPESAKASYPGDATKAAKTFYIQLDGQREATVTLSDLEPGVYAVAVMHDEDGDKKFRTGLFGIPREGFGFSKNPTVYFGAPSFSKVSFDPAVDKTLDIKIKYF